MDRCRLVVVDDDVRFARALVNALAGERHFEVAAIASDGDGAVASAGPDVHVALVDVRMPEGGGPAITRRLSRERPHVRVVGMSVAWSEVSRQQMRDAGAVATIDKTDAIEDLFAVVRDACGSRQRVRPE